MKKYILPTLAFLTIVGSASSQNISGTFAIKNVQTGVYMRIKDANKKDGTPIVAYSPVNWKCVTWDFKSEESNVYQLKNLFSDKTLQPVSTASDGMALEEKPLIAGAQNQQFEFIQDGKNVYLIRLKGTEFYLTPSNDQGEINSPIVLRKKANGQLQQWTLVEQHPVM